MTDEETYVVHYTVVNPLPDSIYGTTPPDYWVISVAHANAYLAQGRRVYITKRSLETGDVEITFHAWLPGDIRYSYPKEAVIAVAAKDDIQLKPEEIQVEDDQCLIDGMLWFDWLEAMTGE